MRALVILTLLAVVLGGCAGRIAERPGAVPSDQTTIADPSTIPSGTAPEETTGSTELRTVKIDASSGESVEVRVEIADSLFEQARGLMYRTALAEDRGMLFVYDDERRRSFYMKNTLIPLSIAFMDAEGRIVDIQDMEPLDDEPPHYVSARPARYALEVNRGFYAERGVVVGDRAELPV